MSALIRALMAQQGQEEPGGNLATITDGGIVKIEQAVKTKATGLNAKLKKGHTYNVKFSIDIDITEHVPGQPAWSYSVRFGNYNYWHNAAKFVNLTAPVGKRHWDVDMKDVTCYEDADGVTTGLAAFEVLQNNIASGTVHCYDLEVYEV